MDFWVAFWTWLLRLSLLAFAGLTVVVAVGGLFDIRAMLRAVRRHPPAD